MSIRTPTIHPILAVVPGAMPKLSLSATSFYYSAKLQITSSFIHCPLKILLTMGEVCFGDNSVCLYKECFFGEIFSKGLCHCGRKSEFGAFAKCLESSVAEIDCDEHQCWALLKPQKGFGCHFGSKILHVYSITFTGVNIQAAKIAVSLCWASTRWLRQLQHKKGTN